MSRKAPAVEGATPFNRALVVEDDGLIAMTIEQALLDAGCAEVRLSASTVDAMDVLRAWHPDVVVLDVHLSDRDDGWAIAELLRELGPSRPQIIFSTGTPDAIPPHVAELGSVLEKPYQADALIALLRQPAKSGLLSRIKNALQ